MEEILNKFQSALQDLAIDIDKMRSQLQQAIDSKKQEENTSDFTNCGVCKFLNEKNDTFCISPIKCVNDNQFEEINTDPNKECKEAFDKGLTIQFRSKKLANGFHDCTGNPSWLNYNDYRVKPSIPDYTNEVNAIVDKAFAEAKANTDTVELESNPLLDVAIRIRDQEYACCKPYFIACGACPLRSKSCGNGNGKDSDYSIRVNLIDTYIAEHQVDNIKASFKQSLFPNECVKPNPTIIPYTTPQPHLKDLWFIVKGGTIHYRISRFDSSPDTPNNYEIYDEWFSNEEMFNQFTHIDGSLIGQESNN